jgi:rubrerythrin
MHPMTEENLKAAFAGESKAHMKYILFADKAEKEGRLNTARLFRAIAYAEKVHAGNHLAALGGINSTHDNLEVALAGENFEVEEMYPVYNNAAKFQKETQAEKTTHYALEAEKVHAQMYDKAKGVLQAKEDIDLDSVYICPVCGFTAQGSISDFCPVCGVKKDMFKEF